MASLLLPYFPLPIHLSGAARAALDLDLVLAPLLARRYPPIVACRRLASCLQADRGPAAPPVTAAQLHLYGTLLNVYRYLVAQCAELGDRGRLATALRRGGVELDQPAVAAAMEGFEAGFPPVVAVSGYPQQLKVELVLSEMLLVRLATENRALDPFRQLFDDRQLAQSVPAYRRVADTLAAALTDGPSVPGLDVPLMEALRAPLKAAPDSLAGQLGYIRETWGDLLPRDLFEGVLTAFDILDEEQAARGMGGPGPSRVLEFGAGAVGAWDRGRRQMLEAGHVAGYDQPEYEAFSPDADWMSTVVLMAKMTHVWLDQLSRWHGYPITRLDQVPDSELDQLAACGFTGLWLIGLWERSAASRRIKELCGNPEAHASAYSLYDYTIADDLGGEAAFQNLKQRAWQRGIRLASDMVPNHTGIYSRWVVEHPDWFVQSDYPPFPGYRFNGEDLSGDPRVTIQIEDGYWSKDDAAVAFRMIDRRDGRTRYLYHGNDGTSIPWNDTAQLNYLIPEVREAVMQTILHVARLTPIIRFDAAMTLAKKHYQRLWFPQRGLGGGIPSRAEHAMSRDEFDAVFPQEFWREVVDRVGREVPDTLLLAEAFWMMEGYFVRTLGMHRVYNSAFMNMLKEEENAKYRQTIKNVLEFNPEILKRFVNFMNNPDEKTAVEQFGSQGKYFGACVLLATMPGLPMFGHGQLEGFKEKYGMEYRRAYWDEQVDQGLLEGHRLWIFPLLKKRWLFSGSEHYCLYDFCCNDGSVDDHVFAYSNRAGAERALVIYNNRHGQTAGWIRQATAQTQQHIGLADALGLDSGPGRFVSFRDLASGLEYLRSSAEIHQQGLYVELGPYEFHIFWEYQEQQDSQEASWGALCQELAGRGVASLAEELAQLRHRPFLNAYRSVCDQLAAIAPGAFTSAEPGLTKYLLQLRSVIALESNEQTDVTLLIEQLQAAYKPAVVRKTVQLLRRAGVSRELLPSGRTERRAFLAVLVLGHMVAALGDDPMSSYGLQRPVAAFIAGSVDHERRWGQYQAARCGAVAAAWPVWNDPVWQDSGERLAALLELPQVSRFLLVHDDAGVSWFNKERFEEFVCWLTIRACFEGARGACSIAVPTMGLTLLAAGAEYRLRRLLRLAAEADVCTPQEHGRCGDC